jgi:hypothetical protein
MSSLHPAELPGHQRDGLSFPASSVALPSAAARGAHLHGDEAGVEGRGHLLAHDGPPEQPDVGFDNIAGFRTCRCTRCSRSARHLLMKYAPINGGSRTRGVRPAFHRDAFQLGKERDAFRTPIRGDGRGTSWSRRCATPSPGF